MLQMALQRADMILFQELLFVDKYRANASPLEIKLPVIA
jgi:hypothetical protein